MSLHSSERHQRHGTEAVLWGQRQPRAALQASSPLPAMHGPHAGNVLLPVLRSPRWRPRLCPEPDEHGREQKRGGREKHWGMGGGEREGRPQKTTEPRMWRRCCSGGLTEHIWCKLIHCMQWETAVTNLHMQSHIIKCNQTPQSHVTSLELPSSAFPCLSPRPRWVSNLELVPFAVKATRHHKVTCREEPGWGAGPGGGGMGGGERREGHMGLEGGTCAIKCVLSLSARHPAVEALPPGTTAGAVPLSLETGAPSPGSTWARSPCAVPLSPSPT